MAQYTQKSRVQILCLGVSPFASSSGKPTRSGGFLKYPEIVATHESYISGHFMLGFSMIFPIKKTFKKNHPAIGVPPAPWRHGENLRFWRYHPCMCQEGSLERSPPAPGAAAVVPEKIGVVM
jgi:hypothetical protein